MKAYLGHTPAPASGDQTAFALGTWAHGWIPGIDTIDAAADDVHHDHLRIAPEHLEIDPGAMDAALVNSKGFGGNNATGLILAPHVAMELLAARHGKAALQRYRTLSEGTGVRARENTTRRRAAAMQGRSTATAMASLAAINWTSSGKASAYPATSARFRFSQTFGPN